MKYNVGDKVILQARISDIERETCKDLTRFVDEYNGTIVTIKISEDSYYSFEESPSIYCFLEDEVTSSVAYARYIKLRGLYE